MAFYNGVRYTGGGGEPFFYLSKGEIDKGPAKFGIWQMDMKTYNPTHHPRGAANCGCGRWTCEGKRVPHAFFACPYCGVIIAEHRRKGCMPNALSLWCPACERHLYVILEGWNEKYWDEALAKKD